MPSSHHATTIITIYHKEMHAWKLLEHVKWSAIHIELVIAHIWYLSNRSCIMHNNTNKPKGMDMEIDMGPNGTYSK